MPKFVAVTERPAPEPVIRFFVEVDDVGDPCFYAELPDGNVERIGWIDAKDGCFYPDYIKEPARKFFSVNKTGEIEIR